MKGIKIEILLSDDDKIISGIKTKGFDKNRLSDQFELLGILENLKNIVNKRIKRLSEAER